MIAGYVCVCSCLLDLAFHTRAQLLWKQSLKAASSSIQSSHLHTMHSTPSSSVENPPTERSVQEDITLHHAVNFPNQHLYMVCSFWQGSGCIVATDVGDFRKHHRAQPAPPVIINFVDSKKVFDSVHIPSLWRTLEYCGIQISSKSVHFRRSYSRTRKNCSFAP